MSGAAVSPQHLALSFPVNPCSVAEARFAIARFAHEAGFDAATVSDITLAGGEACNDAIECSPRGTEFSLSCDVLGGVLRVSVTYVGDLPPRSAINEGRVRPHDLGALLMRRLMDTTERYTDADGSTHIVLERALGDLRRVTIP